MNHRIEDLTAGETEAIRREESPADGNDFYRTFARVQRDRETSQTPTAAAPQEPPWRVVPNEDEILAEKQLRGICYEDAKVEVTRQLIADARRLEAAVPESVEEISSAVAAADAAKERVDELLSARRAVLDGLESAIYSLGKLRLEIRWAESLKLNEAAEQSLARKVLDLQLARHTTPCPANEASFAGALRNLAHLKAITPYVAEYVARLEAKATKQIGEIRAAASDGGVELANFLKLLADERRANKPGAALDADTSLYEGL